MIRKLAQYGFAALLSFGAISVAPLPAAADDFGIEFRFGDRNPPPGYYHRPRPERYGCSPREALETARWNGFRRAEIVDVNRRRVVVEGRVRGGWRQIVFANVEGCPIVRR